MIDKKLSKISLREQQNLGLLFLMAWMRGYLGLFNSNSHRSQFRPCLYLIDYTFCKYWGTEIPSQRSNEVRTYLGSFLRLPQIIGTSRGYEGVFPKEDDPPGQPNNGYWHLESMPQLLVVSTKRGWLLTLFATLLETMSK